VISLFDVGAQSFVSASSQDMAQQRPHAQQLPQAYHPSQLPPQHQQTPYINQPRMPACFSYSMLAAIILCLQ